MITLITLLFYILDFILNDISLNNINSFLPFVLLIIVFPCFKNKKYFIIYSGFIAILFSYNIRFLLINIFSFIVIAYYICFFYKYRKNNLINSLELSLSLLIIYIIILGLLFLFTGNLKLSILFIPIFSTIIFNSIVLIIFYLGIKKIISS